MKKARRLVPMLILALAGGLTSCTLGEAIMPDPPPIGQAAAQEIGAVAPVPDPIPHALEGREECFTCHAIGAVDAPPVPGDHGQDVDQCATCHAVWMQPGIAAVAPPAIGHDVEGRDDCLTCHKIGTAGTPRVPEHHAGLPSSICRSCHLLGEEVTGGTAEAVSLASEIPHGLEGFATCTVCHEQGGGGAPQFPADHTGRTDDICTACHSAASPAPTSETAAPPTEEPAAPPAETPAASEPPTAGAPPAIPHTLAGHDACTLCHEKGGPAVPQFPADHSGRPDSTCTACHAAAAEEPSDSAAMAGADLYSTNCAACHGDEGQGGAVASAPINTAEVLADDDELQSVIGNGEGSMPGFAARLSGEEIGALIEFMRSWLP